MSAGLIVSIMMVMVVIIAIVDQGTPATIVEGEMLIVVPFLHVLATAVAAYSYLAEADAVVANAEAVAVTTISVTIGETIVLFPISPSGVERICRGVGEWRSHIATFDATTVELIDFAV